MHIDITEENHSRVTWQGRTPLVRILIGLLIGTLCLVGLVLPSPSPVRWPVTVGLVALGLVVASTLAVTTPLVDGGSLERLPDGGEVQRSRSWLFIGERSAWSLPLNDVASFDVEMEEFEDTPPDVYSLARLWATDAAGRRLRLTEWAEPELVNALREALSRVGRRETESV